MFESHACTTEASIRDVLETWNIFIVSLFCEIISSEKLNIFLVLNTIEASKD